MINDGLSIVFVCWQEIRNRFLVAPLTVKTIQSTRISFIEI